MRVGVPPVPPGAIAALVLLAAALLLVDGRVGAGRLGAALAPPPVADGGGAAGLRPAWVGVGAAAVGALVWAVAGTGAGAAAGGLAALAGVLAARHRQQQEGPPDAAPADLAGAWQLVAVCLEAGLPVAAAVAAAAEPVGGRAGLELRRVAGLLELGADPAEAWSTAERLAPLAAFARAAGRSAATGSALAQVSRALADRVRAELADTAQARAQRAAVLITAPLGLCFLPAFLVLGIAPVVIGLAGEALAPW